MIYNHRIKRHGVYYEAGQEVPDIKISDKPLNLYAEKINTDENSIPKRGRPKKTE